MIRCANIEIYYYIIIQNSIQYSSNQSYIMVITLLTFAIIIAVTNFVLDMYMYSCFIKLEAYDDKRCNHLLTSTITQEQDILTNIVCDMYICSCLSQYPNCLLMALVSSIMQSRVTILQALNDQRCTNLFEYNYTTPQQYKLCSIFNFPII